MGLEKGGGGKGRETYDAREVEHVAYVLEEAFCDDKTACECPAFLFFDDAFENPFHVLQVVVLVPPDGASADLDALSDCIIDCFVGHYDVSSFAKGWDHAGDGRECLGVDDAGFCAKMGGDVGFGLDVHILGAVEPRWRAGANTISAEDLDGAFLEVRICAQSIEVVGC